jgi:hypothetical protein
MLSALSAGAAKREAPQGDGRGRTARLLFAGEALGACLRNRRTLLNRPANPASELLRHDKLEANFSRQPQADDEL